MSEENKEAEVKPAPETVAETPKKKCKCRKLARIGLIVLACFVAVIIVGMLVLDSIIAGAVTKVAPMFTGTKVELASVRTRLLLGRVELVGFKVGNPEGFHHPNAFELSKFVCQVQPLSLLSDKIIVDEVLIEGMAVDYEPNFITGSNLDIIQKNVEKITGKPGDKKPAEKPAEPAAEKKPGPKVVIKSLKVGSVTMSFSNKATGARIPLPLPPISMTNIGEGKSMGEVINDFYVALMKGVGDALSSGAVQSIGTGAKEAGAAASEAVNKTVDSIKKLF